MEDLIASVYKREPLWNPSHGLHKNVPVLKKLWHDVAIELNTDEKYVKTKWKNIRAYFFKVLRKLEHPECGDGADIIAASQWTHFEQLMFLKGAIPTESERYSNFSIPNPISAEQSLNEDQDTGDSLDVKSLTSDGRSAASPAGTSNSNPRKTTKKRKKYDTNSFLEQTHQILELRKRKIEILEKDSNSQPSSDMLFFKSLLPYMADIPMIQKLRLRSKIQDLILSELEIVSNNIQQPRNT